MLDETASALVNEVESHIDSAIEIEIDGSRIDKMACVVDINGARIITPNSNYFPSDSTFHELLHIRRFCVNAIPKIVVCDAYNNWTPELEDILIGLDNDIEHFIIVPVECESYEDRKDYWVTKIVTAINNIHASGLTNDDKERRALIYWAFSNHVFSDGDSVQASDSLIQELNLEERADSFLDEINNYISNKEKLVRVFFDHLDLSLDIGCLEYIDCINRNSHEEPIPELNQ